MKASICTTGFPYLGKDETRDTSMSVPTNVIMKLINHCSSLATMSLAITSSHLWMSLHPYLRKKCSLVGTNRNNRRELPQVAKAKQQLHDTTLFKTATSSTSEALRCYQCKKAKSVMILNTLHSDAAVSSENNPKKKPETVLFYNKTKAGVDVVDQMTRKYSVKAACRRWPVHVFYNVIDLAIINS